MSEGKVIELVKGVGERLNTLLCFEKETSEAVFTDNTSVFEIIPIISTVLTIPNEDEENEEDGETEDTDEVRVVGAVEDNRDARDPGGRQSTSTENDKSETEILGGKVNEFSSSLDRQSIQRNCLSLEGEHKKTYNVSCSFTASFNLENQHFIKFGLCDSELNASKFSNIKVHMQNPMPRANVCGVSERDCGDYTTDDIQEEVEC